MSDSGARDELNPYIKFSRDSWKQYRRDTPMTLTESEIKKLRGINEPISIQETEEIYLPLARLLNLYVKATQNLYKVSTKFLNYPEPSVPYIIGVSGSVGVGKSTTSRLLQSLLSRWPNHRRVDIVNTDGFLFSNAELSKRGLMERKGFPESYDLPKLVKFLEDLKSGQSDLKVPIYSHYDYDVKPDYYQTVVQPDILILEGLNILQDDSAKSNLKTKLFISDFIDFSLFVDANTQIIKKWYLDRFMLFRERAVNDPNAFFYQFTKMSDKEALAFADNVWTTINEANLTHNILPFKNRAKLILTKGQNHLVEEILLRKI